MRLTATLKFFFGLLAPLLLVSWIDGGERLVPRPLPPAPDYSDASQWYIRERGGVADLFYIVSTETGDYLLDGDTCHYANTYDAVVSRGILKEMRAVDSLFSGACNYFSPYYRQVTMQSWASEDTALARLPVALGDVARSWDYYLSHLNGGRPFVIAGFSQGAHAMLELLKHMPDSVHRQLVAAYSIGYKITQETLDSFPTIRPAQGATDLGVVINYNSVRSPECVIPIVSGGNMVNINPVNWRTDTATAQFVSYGRKSNDTLTVRCDPESRLCIVGGFTKERPMPVIGVPGNYHNMELRFYHPYIRQNIADRVKAYIDRPIPSSLKSKRIHPSKRKARRRPRRATGVLTP